MHNVFFSSPVPVATEGHAEGYPSIWRNNRLHEEACEWLNEKLTPRTQSRHTWAQAARAVASWLDYLEAINVDWRFSSRDDLISYRDAYLSSISPATMHRYSENTVRVRMTYIIEFLDFAKYRGWINLPAPEYYPSFEITAEPPANVKNIDGRPISNTWSLPTANDSLRKLIPKGGQDETVRVLRKDELSALLRWAGPRPSQRQSGDGGCDRDRIALDLAWAVGLRADEFSSLSVYQFDAMVTDPNYPGEMFQISIRGKGNKIRIVDVPAWLVADIQNYIQGERHRALRKRGPRAHERQLVLNCETSRNRAGFPITVKGMQALMERACRGSGLLRRIERTNPETGDVIIMSTPRFSLHCLRHTYAVMTYKNYRASGFDDLEAWKYIQMQLGHKSASTTMDIYLRHVNKWSDFRSARPLYDMFSA